MYHRMWGAAEHDRSEGVHRPLTVTALVFRDASSQDLTSESQQVLLAIDHCLLAHEQVEAIQRRASEVAGIPPSSIVLTFSHTHAAGLLNMDREHLPGGELLADYFDTLTETIAKTVQTAAAELVDANITYATGRCGLAAHRDLYDEKSAQWVCGFNPAGKVDDSVLVARVTNTSGALLATCVHYACHPTTLAWDNRLVSPDFPGAMRETVEAHTDAPCVFLQGASGDVGPVRGFVGDTETADSNGRELGFAALAALESMPASFTSFSYIGPVESGAVIGTWADQAISDERRNNLSRWQVQRTEVPMSYRSDNPTLEDIETNRASLVATEQEAREIGNSQLAADTRALIERETRKMARLTSLPEGDAFPYEIVLWRIGDAIWIAIQGEPYNILQTELRSRFPYTPLVISTIANAWGPSYLPPQETYGQGVYQESIAILEPGSLESLIESLSTMIADIQR
jgi:hypothetical protein